MLLFISLINVNYDLVEIWNHFDLVKECRSSESVMVHLETKLMDGSSSEDEDIFTMEQHVYHSSTIEERPSARLVVVLQRDYDLDGFKRIVQHLSRRSVDILKATLVRVEDYDQRNFIIFTCYIRVPTALMEPSEQRRFREEMKRLPFLDGSVLRWLDLHKHHKQKMSLHDAEMVMAYGRLVHCLLAEEQPLVFTPYHIEEFLTQYPEILEMLLKLIYLR